MSVCVCTCVTGIHRERLYLSPAWFYQVFQGLPWKHWKERFNYYDFNYIPIQFCKRDSDRMLDVPATKSQHPKSLHNYIKNEMKLFTSNITAF